AGPLPRREIWFRLRAQHLAGVFVPVLPPLQKSLPLLRQPALVEPQQRFERGPVALVRAGIPRLEPIAQRAEALGGDVAVVGVAEDFLHLLDGGIDGLLECTRVTVGE